MQAKDEELHKVKEKQVMAEQQLQELEVKQQQVHNTHSSMNTHYTHTHTRAVSVISSVIV